jgi:hypothetical protein
MGKLKLTSCEREMLDWLSTGRSYKQIAAAECVCVNIVRNHHSCARMKLGRVTPPNCCSWLGSCRKWNQIGRKCS